MTDKHEPKILTDLREFMAELPQLEDPPDDNGFTPAPPAINPAFPFDAVLSIDFSSGVPFLFQMTEAAQAAYDRERKQRRIAHYHAVLQRHGVQNMVDLIGKVHEPMPAPVFTDDAVDVEFLRATVLPAVRIALAEMQRQARVSALQMDRKIACGCDQCVLETLDQHANDLDNELAAVCELANWIRRYE
jgi:hypothetical protein